jgi:hypothetical protein
VLEHEQTRARHAYQRALATERVRLAELATALRRERDAAAAQFAAVLHFARENARLETAATSKETEKKDDPGGEVRAPWRTAMDLAALAARHRHRHAVD